MKMYKYTAPDLESDDLKNADDAVFVPAPKDGVAPENFHAMSIFPEYFKVDGEWLLAEESRMDCVPVLKDGKIEVVEPRRLKKGDLVGVGRTENGEDGIYVYPYGFMDGKPQKKDVFAFRTSRSRETAFSVDYDELYEILRYEKDHGKIVWVMGPAFSFDHDARKAFPASSTRATFTRFLQEMLLQHTILKELTSKHPSDRTYILRNLCPTVTTIICRPSTG